jgi:protein involved in polysaccharide export with SLBB domain
MVNDNFKPFSFCVVFVLGLAFLPRIGAAQLTGPSSSSSTIIAPMAGAEKMLTPPAASGEAMIFESGVDPREYHLGPGDVLQLRLWTANESFYPQVSADQVLVIPRIGEFDVRGMTLAELKDSVYQKADRMFKNFSKENQNGPAASAMRPVTLTIYQPRKIYVNVRGDVATSGEYILSGSTRANVAVDVANKTSVQPSTPPDIQSQRAIINDEQRLKELQSYFGKRERAAPSERYITVAHSDGTSDRIDLVRYRALHDPMASPLLREGDVVVVPLRNKQVGSLGVYGAVVQPGDFEFVEGDSLSNAIAYAFGTASNADLHHVELTRMTPDGEALPPKVYDLIAIRSHAAPDVPLVRDDRIFVQGFADTRQAAVVVVRGQVRQPGVFPIVNGKTKLAEVIHEAGGLTPAAYPAAGVVLRYGRYDELTVGSPEDIAQISRQENLGVSDTMNLQKQLSTRTPTVVVDMERVLVKGEESADIPLQDGDEIVIPEQPTTVYVSGFVNNAGYVTYQAGAPLSYYVASAGGYSQGSTPSRTVVIKMRSKAWLDPSDTKIEPGDEIFVPKKPDLPENYNVQSLSAIGGLIVGIGSFLVGLYLTFIKKP